MKILVIEDDLQTQEVLRTVFMRDPMLGGMQVEVIQARNGVDGTEAFAREKPDAVVVDLLLPKLDGFEVCKLIRANQAGRDVPLVIISGIYKDVAPRVRAEFAADFFAKPLQMRELCRALATLLTRPAPKTTSTVPAVKTPSSAPAARSPLMTPAVASGSAVTATPTISKFWPTPTRSNVPAVVTGGTSVQSAVVQSAEPQRKGDLSHTSAARLLLELHDESATGILRLHRGEMKRAIYFLDGDVLCADSNLRAETLGEFLTERGVLTREQIEQGLELAQLRKIRLGEALVQLGFLTEQAALSQLTMQMQIKVANGLRWRQGEFEFFQGDNWSSKIVRCNIDLPRLLLKVLPRIPSTGLPRARVRPTARFARHRDTICAVYGIELVERLAAGPVATAEAAEARDAALLGQLRALFEMELLEIVHDSGTGKAHSGPEEATTSSAHPPVRDALREELFTVSAAPFRSPTPAVPAGLPASTQEDRAARKVILGAYLAVAGKSAPEVLGVAAKASASEIEEAYRAAVERFAPARFDSLNLGPEQARLEQLHGLLRQAYEELSASTSAEASKGEPDHAIVSQRTMQAELMFREGERKLRQGDATRAETFFQAAVEMSPEHADYHAYLGWACYLAAGRGVSGSDVASPHLQRALAIHPDLPKAHEFVGLVALEMNDLAGAARHLERLLETDPAHEHALVWLEQTYKQQGAELEIERVYRKALQLLGDSNLERSVDVLLRLSEWYRTSGDEHRAELALEAAEKRAPRHERVRQLREQTGLAERPPPLMTPPVQSGRTISEHRKSQVDALRAETVRLARSPTPQVGSLQQAVTAPHAVELLSDATIANRFEALVKVGRRAAALQHAAALVLRGRASTSMSAYYEQHRPRMLGATFALNAAAIARILHPDDIVEAELQMREFGHILRSVAPVEIPADATSVSAPPLFASVLAHVTGQLGVDLPQVRQHDREKELSLMLLDTSPPALLVAPSLLAARDRISLAYLLARELYFNAPGRVLMAGRKPTQIKPYLQRTGIDFDRYYMGVRRTGERMGLLMCADLAVAQNASRDDTEACFHLETFALSDEFATLCDELALRVE